MLATVGATVGVLLGFCTLLGLGVRYVLVPYLRDHLVRPVQETHHQVTANSHQSPNPTVLDLIAELRDEQRATRSEQQAMNRALITHVGDYRAHGQR